MSLLKPSEMPEFHRLFSWPTGKDLDNLLDRTNVFFFNNTNLIVFK